MGDGLGPLALSESASAVVDLWLVPLGSPDSLLMISFTV